MGRIFKRLQRAEIVIDLKKIAPLLNQIQKWNQNQ